MTLRYHRCKADEDKEEIPPLHYGHRLRTDHILFGSESEKGSDGESSCLVVQDLQRIAGAWGSDRSQCFIKTDGGQELKQRNQ